MSFRRNRKRKHGLKKEEKNEFEGSMCKATAGHDGKPQFSSAQVNSIDLTQIFEEDKRYGKFYPRNGKYFTYAVYDEDDEITNKQVLKSIQYSFRRISIRTNLVFKRAREGEYADFKIYFETVESDPRGELGENTLMYHYYPISNYEHSLRGVCCVNKRFYWTMDGNPISMFKVDPDNYEEDTTWQGKTWDFDQVYTHEVLHGLGLPHSKVAGNVMSPNYGIMSEWLTEEEDIPRLQHKYGDRGLSESRIRRWLSWLKHASDRGF